MSVFKEISCASCQRKTKALFRNTLTDGSCLCSSCVKAVPAYIRKSLKRNYGFEDYKNFLSYVEYSNNELRPVFSETDRYYTIHIDADNYLFYIGNSLNEKTLFFCFQNVLDFDLAFKGETVKEGFSGVTVTGKVLMAIEMRLPYFYYETTLDNWASSKAMKIMRGTKIKYENPEGMDEFLDLFMLLWNESVMLNEYSSEEMAQNYNKNFFIQASPMLQQALALFMFDDLSEVTLSKLKLQRNRLMQTFHPDLSDAEDTRYAQKINEAYEIIKKNL